MMGYKSDEELKFESIFLDVVTLHAKRVIDTSVFNPDNLTFDVHKGYGFIARDMILHMEQKIASQKLDKITYYKPSSWWQHFKHECFPNWLKKKFPVKFDYEEYEISALYPKLAIQDGQHIIQVHKLGDESWQ